jgi:hypothetical protein
MVRIRRIFGAHLGALPVVTMVDGMPTGLALIRAKCLPIRLVNRDFSVT